jgi:hypothetical protein
VKRLVRPSHESPKDPHLNVGPHATKARVLSHI